MNKLVRNIVFEEDGILRFWSTDAFNPQPDEVYLRRFADKNPIMVDGADIPEDLEYNVSWEIKANKKGLQINMGKAKEVHKEFLRREREPYFKEADDLYIQTLSKKKQDKVVTDRQNYLRDITDDVKIKNAKTIADLKAVKVKEWTDKPKVNDLPNKT